MKIAVTGATGFIGRAVLTELSRRDIAALACVHMNHGAVSAAGHQVISLDIHDAASLTYERLGRPDVLIHLAWSGLPAYRSLHHIETELPAQYRFLSSLVKAGLPSLIVAGTCFEYGMQSGPLHEGLPTRPENPYGFAKDVLRRKLEFLKAAQPFALTWARFFYLHGEGQAESSLLPQLRRSVAAGEQVFNMSGGEQLRDYLPVEEAARLFVKLAVSSQDNGVVNICSGKPVSVRRLVEGWVRDNGWTINLNLGHYAYPDYEPMAFWGDRQKLDALLEEE
jgi:dTDP-6-deoxy-L-talose 4-dehydrogenase (NAD+)